jgi:hypothetical protein
VGRVLGSGEPAAEDLGQEDVVARSRKPWFAALLAVGSTLALSGFGSAAPAAAGGWTKAHFIAGFVKPAGIVAIVSCSSPGDCGAVGTYADHVPADKLFVIAQVRGQWTKPVLIPSTIRTATPAASPGGLACFSVGNCTMVGSYTDAAGNSQAFIVNDKLGTWRKVFWIPGLAALDRGHSAELDYLSCPSDGNCTASGSYTDASKVSRPFVVTEVHGVWDQAKPVPHLTGLPDQAPGSTLRFGAISCASPGNCSAGGSYSVTSGGSSAGFVDDEVKGVWGPPEAVPGLAALNVGLQAGITAISCSSPGNCGAGGDYAESQGQINSFVLNETNGTWGPATAVRSAIPSFDGPDGDFFATISCSSPGNCTGGGTDAVENDALAADVYVITETHGTWGKGVALPGWAKLNQGDQSSISQISCSSPGNCGVAGAYSAQYDFGFEYTQPFVANEVNGKWNKAIGVPGIKIQPVKGTGQQGATTTISCTAPNQCTAGGSINSEGPHGDTAFTDTRT